MEQIDVVNGLIFNQLGINTKDSLEDRVIIQKKIYLLQSLGIDLGYSYNWYLKGPYSTTLTNYIYEKLDFLNQSKDIFEQYQLNNSVTTKIAKVNSISSGKPHELSTDAWYELIASLIYICKNRSSWEIAGDEESIISALRAKKPHFSVQNCEDALNYIRTNDLMQSGEQSE